MGVPQAEQSRGVEGEVNQDVRGPPPAGRRDEGSWRELTATKSLAPTG